MRATLTLSTLALPCALTLTAHGQVGIGQWRDHYPYLNTRTVVEGNGVAYCASRNAVFSTDPSTNEMTRLTKVNALSDVDVTALGWSPALNALVIGYANGNLDLLRGESSVNLSDIKRSGLIGDKRINSILCEGGLAYLGCGFGIVVMDLERSEVNDTWIIGANAEQRNVNAITFHGDSIYAATDKGVYSAYRNEPNLAAFTNWHRRTDIPNYDKTFNGVVSFAGKLVVNFSTTVTNTNDTVYYESGGWQRLAAAYGQRNTALKVRTDGSRLVVPQQYTVRQYDTNMQEVFHLTSIEGQGIEINGAAPRAGGGVWVATRTDGLGRGEGLSSDRFFSPNGPKTTNVVSMDASSGIALAVTGSVAGNWTNAYLHEGYHLFENSSWHTIRQLEEPLLNGVNGFAGGAVDPMAVVIDPEDPAHAFVGFWDEGVLELRNGTPQTYWNATNSTLGTNGPVAEGIVDVAGLDIDKDGNLWVANSNTPAVLSVRKADGNWKSFDPGGLLANNTLVGQVIAARENDLKWLVRPRGNGLLVFTDGGTLDDDDDDRFKVLNTFEHQGKLPTLDAYSVAEDLDGEVWVGTAKGIAVFYNPEAIFSENGENFDCQQILIEQDGNVQILLETESIVAIAVDGANRKWFGTQTSGVYLVSPDGTEQLAHFTAANSPLPSDNVVSIAIDGSTGEVFFATDQGIISYRGEATDGERGASCASVFPNPVRESYQGPVAITGLVAESDVRITDIAGNLVYKTTSLGGQAIWPATDLAGQRVSTGVYLVMASDPTGASTCNTKVLVVR